MQARVLNEARENGIRSPNDFGGAYYDDNISARALPPTRDKNKMFTDEQGAAIMEAQIIGKRLFNPKTANAATYESAPYTISGQLAADMSQSQKSYIRDFFDWLKSQ